jgi:hypothetical protein
MHRTAFSGRPHELVLPDLPLVGFFFEKVHMRTLTSPALTKARQALIQLIRRTNFGWLENLVVRDGEPVLKPLPKTIREVKFQGEDAPAASYSEWDRSLPEPFVRLFRYFDQVQNVTIERLLLKYSLPFKADAIELLID